MIASLGLQLIRIDSRLLLEEKVCLGSDGKGEIYERFLSARSDHHTSPFKKGESGADGDGAGVPFET